MAKTPEKIAVPKDVQETASDLAETTEQKKLRLDPRLKNTAIDRPPSILVDLDNAPSEGRMVDQHTVVERTPVRTTFNEATGTMREDR